MFLYEKLMEFLCWRRNSAKIMPEYTPIIVGDVGCETAPIVITRIPNATIPVREPMRFHMPPSVWPHTDGEQVLVSNKPIQTAALLVDTTPIANAEVY